jgi:hypothetical protein
MKREIMNTIHRHARYAMIPCAILAVATTGAHTGWAQQSAQPTFPSATAAGQALFQAVQGNNTKTVTNILGGPTELASSGDPAQDKLDRQTFVQKYQQMHRVGLEPDGSMTLYIGAENWPFPVPLVQKNGAWRFDPDAGEQEVLFRRIGEDELAAIDTARQLAAAAKQYHSNPRAASQVDSRLGSLVSAAAGGSASEKPVLIQGYYFRVAAKQPTSSSGQQTPGKTNGGVAIIAYPAEYRSSGVKTFIVTDNDVINEKDLGPKTTARASTMSADYKGGWDAADEK